MQTETTLSDRLYKKCAGNRWIPGRFVLENGKISFTLTKEQHQVSISPTKLYTLKLLRVRYHSFERLIIKQRSMCVTHYHFPLFTIA